MILDAIIYNRQDVDAIGKEEEFTETENGMKRRKMNTEGRKLCIQWKDRSTNWVALKYTNKSYPAELADYASMMKIDDKPAFVWRVPYVQNMREII